MTTMTEPTTHVLEAPGATVTYDVRPGGAAGEPLLMLIESHFPSTEAMEQVLAMGMEEGLTQAVGQIDAILAEGVAA